LSTQSLNHDRIRGLDTLRAIAILIVICWHGQGKITPGIIKAVGHYGWSGVDLFFVLSGYLIANQLFRSLRKQGGLSLPAFYWRRAFRILPCFFVVLALYFLWPGFRENKLNVSIWRFLTFTQNFGLQFGAFSHAWSLCIEEQFYWLFPLIALALNRSRKRTSFFIFVGVILLGMFVRWVVWKDVAISGLTERELLRAYYRKIYYPTYSRLDGLTMGVAVAAIENYLPQVWEKLGARANSLSVIGCLLVAVALRLFESQYSIGTVVMGFPLLAIGFGCLVGSAATRKGILARARVLGATAMATLSYSIYLTHKQVLHLVAEAFEKNKLPNSAFLPVALFSILFVGWALHQLVEKPFLKMREKLGTGVGSTPIPLTRPLAFVTVWKEKWGDSG